MYKTVLFKECKGFYTSSLIISNSPLKTVQFHICVCGRMHWLAVSSPQQTASAFSP